MKQNNVNKRNFKAVEYMRKIRAELSELYHQDKQKYFADLKRAYKEFKIRQNKAYG